MAGLGARGICQPVIAHHPLRDQGCARTNGAWDSVAKAMRFPPRQARSIRITALDEVRRGGGTNMAELYLVPASRD
jgi:hypothetical protein